jgi:hypothetical protein
MKCILLLVMMLAIALTSLIAMGSTGIVTVNKVTARNTTTVSADTSNATTFEENMTAAGVKPSTGGMTNWTK